MKKFGTQGGLIFGAGAIALQHFLEGMWVRKPWQQFSLLVLMPFRGMSKASIEAMLLEAGEEAGLGMAELRACFEGLRSLSWMVCAPFWAWWYEQCTKQKGTSRNFFLTVSFSAVIRIAFGLAGGMLPNQRKQLEKKVE